MSRLSRRTPLSVSAAEWIGHVVGFPSKTLGAPATPGDTGQGAPRARDLGIPFDGTPGPINDNTVHAIPHDRLRDVLREYNRLTG